MRCCCLHADLPLLLVLLLVSLLMSLLTSLLTMSSHTAAHAGAYIASGRTVLMATREGTQTALVQGMALVWSVKATIART